MRALAGGTACFGAGKVVAWAGDVTLSEERNVFSGAAGSLEENGEVLAGEDVVSEGGVRILKGEMCGCLGWKKDTSGG